MIRKKQNAENVDWIINEEASSVFAFALENTFEDPFDPKHPGFEKMKGLTMVERRELGEKSFVKLDRGDNAKVIIGPGCAVAYMLFEDPILPREFPNTRLVRYRHNDPMHNPGIRVDRTFASMSAYLGGEKGQPEKSSKVKVMTGVKEKGPK
jgi:hypothetical protein